MLHAGDHFLTDVAALGEAHAVQEVEVCFMGEELVLADIGIAVGQTIGDAMRAVAFARRQAARGNERAKSHGRNPRIGRGQSLIRANGHREVFIRCDLDLGAEAVECELLHKTVHL